MTIRNLLAVAPLMLIAALVCTTNVRADEDLLSQLAAAETSLTETADVDIDEEDMGMADVESLINHGEEEVDDTEAVAACYRRFGRSYGFRSYGYRSYGYCSYYYPTCYSSYRYVTPVSYSYCTPAYTSYWGCW